MKSLTFKLIISFFLLCLLAVFAIALVAGNYAPLADLLDQTWSLRLLSEWLQQSLKQAVQQWPTELMWLATSIVLGAALMFAIVVRYLLSPLSDMKANVTQLARGNYGSQQDCQRKDDLGEVVQELNVLSSRLSENRLARQTWLADISHELRTPVTVLVGEIEAIKDGLRPFDQQQLDSLENEGKRLKHLINDLYELTLSDIGGLKYEFQVSNLTEQLASFLNTYQQQLADAGLRLSQNLCAHDLWINADSKRLEQLFTNLANNAKAYTDQPGELRVILQQQGKHAVLVFEDSAPNVPDDFLQKVFEPLFRQDESRSRRVAGAGLGLTISRNIVHGHGGNIFAKQSALGGLCVEVHLPLTPSPAR